MTQEEKSKRYDEALERAKYALTTDMDNDGHWAVNYIFPELQQSEDKINEKIRKGLIKSFNTVGTSKWGGLSVQDILAWLEKQKENSIWTDNDRTMVFTLLRDVDQMTYISKEGKDERLEWLNSLDDRFKKDEDHERTDNRTKGKSL